jgi:superfamily II RNA helicase
MRDDGQGRKFSISRINRVFEKTYGISEASVETAFLETFEGKNPPIAEPKISFQRDSDEASELIDQLIGTFGDQGPDRVRDQGSLWSSAKDSAEIENAERDIQHLRDRIWRPFEDRARVLDHFGYLDFVNETVTESGKWLADVRVERPVLVGEVIRQGLFNGLHPKAVAGMMASLAADSDRNFGDLHLSDKLLDGISGLEDIMRDVSKIEWRFGIEPSEEINLSAAAAAEHWCRGIEWGSLVGKTRAEEGDLVRLISRTGEALMQVGRLKQSNPDVASLARETADIMLREPIR